MLYRELFAVLEKAGLSPERGAERLGVSNMTLRRWRRRPGGDDVPEVYARAFRPALKKLVDDGLIEAGSAGAEFEKRDGEDFRGTLRRLGFPEDILSARPGDSGALVQGLSHIGADTDHKKEVDASRRAISAIARWGAEWKERVAAMTRIIDSKELLPVDKLVAYGALFYLITPFDLIPDGIPVVGYLDDFAILGIALWFYRKRFPKVLGARREKGTKT